jgi:hypothetical protein
MEETQRLQEFSYSWIDEESDKCIFQNVFPRDGSRGTVTLSDLQE